MQVGGPVPTIPLQAWQALTSDSPNGWREAEKAFPSVLKGVSKAARYAYTGVETEYSGKQVAEFDLEDPNHVAEITWQALGFAPEWQALGFAPERIRDLQSMRWNRREHLLYWKAQEQKLRQQYFEALGDAEATADVVKALRRFNANVPFPEMGISGKSLRQSMRNRKIAEARDAVGLAPSNKYNRLYQSIEDAWEEEAP
jgi:hypothetical protein